MMTVPLAARLAKRLVRERHVLRLAVGLGVNRDRRDAHLARRADHPARDLAAIGDQDLAEHL